MGDGDNDVYMAKLAEQAERYDEMVEYMKKVASTSETDLSLEERNLLRSRTRTSSARAAPRSASSARSR